MSDSTPNDRTLTWWPIVGAAVIAIIVAVVIVVVGGGDDRPGAKRDENGALTCPSTYNPDKTSDVFWVPSGVAGVDGKKSLVPNTKPSHVTACAYASAARAFAGATLDGHRTLDTGLAAMTKQLSALPKASGTIDYAPSNTETVYLLGVTFDTGYAWIAVPPGSGASNGEFVTARDVYKTVADAYRTGTWTV